MKVYEEIVVSDYSAGLPLKDVAMVGAAVLFNQGEWASGRVGEWASGEWASGRVGEWAGGFNALTIHVHAMPRMIREFWADALALALRQRGPIDRCIADIKGFNFAFEPVMAMDVVPFLKRLLPPANTSETAAHFQFLTALLLLAPAGAGVATLLLRESIGAHAQSYLKKYGSGSDSQARLALQWLFLSALCLTPRMFCYQNDNAHVVISDFTSALRLMSAEDFQDIQALGGFRPVIDLFRDLVQGKNCSIADISRQVLQVEQGAAFLCLLIPAVIDVNSLMTWGSRIPALIHETCHAWESPAYRPFGEVIYFMMASVTPEIRKWMRGVLFPSSLTR